jgi:predicted ester cyclase
MSAEENKEIARRTYAAFEEGFRTGNFDALDEVTDANLVDHNPDPGQAPGLEGVKRAFASRAAAFSNARIIVEDLIAEGDKVVARVTTHATHRGEIFGVPPTGREVTAGLIDILRISGGKVVERWGQFDNLGLLQQIGAIPAPSGPAPASGRSQAKDR